ncbi:MAG: hypothetical protein AAF563_17310 [Pseudomonadota bacterium]
MNHRHRKVLHALFAHPVSANIAPRAVESVIKELGGEIDQRHGGRVGLHLSGHFVEIAHDSHSLKPAHVQQIRKFLESAGIDPGRDYPL